MSIRNEIKKLLLDCDITLSELADLMAQKLSRNYSIQNLSNKLGNETISYAEIKLIAEILNYKIKFEKENNKD